MSKPPGLYDKYIVFKRDSLTMLDDGNYNTDEVHAVDGCFVLRFQDPHARPALEAYAREVEPTNPELARDILSKIGQHVDDCGDSSGEHGLSKEEQTREPATD